MIRQYIEILRSYRKQFTVPNSGLERAMKCAIKCMEEREDYLLGIISESEYLEACKRQRA